MNRCRTQLLDVVVWLILKQLKKLDADGTQLLIFKIISHAESSNSAYDFVVFIYLCLFPISCWQEIVWQPKKFNTLGREDTNHRRPTGWPTTVLLSKKKKKIIEDHKLPKTKRRQQQSNYSWKKLHFDKWSATKNMKYPQPWGCLNTSHKKCKQPKLWSFIKTWLMNCKHLLGCIWLLYCELQAFLLSSNFLKTQTWFFILLAFP